jgi:hypothetical protein
VCTATTQIKAVPTKVAGLVVTSDGSEKITATLRNGAADDSDKLLPTLTIDAGDKGPVGMVPPRVIPASVALRLVITGSGSETTVFTME